MRRSKTQARRTMEKRRALERRMAEKEETAQLAAERREKERREREERPEIYWLKRLAWALWIFTGVETVKCLIEIMPR